MQNNGERMCWSECPNCGYPFTDDEVTTHLVTGLCDDDDEPNLAVEYVFCPDCDMGLVVPWNTLILNPIRGYRSEFDKSRQLYEEGV